MIELFVIGSFWVNLSTVTYLEPGYRRINGSRLLVDCIIHFENKEDIRIKGLDCDFVALSIRIDQENKAYFKKLNDSSEGPATRSGSDRGEGNTNAE